MVNKKVWEVCPMKEEGEKITKSLMQQSSLKMRIFSRTDLHPMKHIMAGEVGITNISNTC